MRRLLALVLVALLGLAPGVLLAVGPGVALAAGSSPSATAIPGQTSPFSPGVPISPVTPSTSTPTVIAPTSTASSGGSGGLSGTTAILIAIGAVVVLGGIAYFIWHDSRRHAPVRHAAALEGVGARSGSKRPPKSRKLSPAERKRRKRGRAR